MTKKPRIAEEFNPKKNRLRRILGSISAGFITFVIMFATFALGLQWLPVIPTLLSTQMDWNLLVALTSFATFSLVVGQFLFEFIAYVQSADQKIRETGESSFNIYKELYDRLMNSKALESRRWVILNIPTLEEMDNDKQAYIDCVNGKLDKRPRGWKGERPPGREHVKDILNTFDFIGFVATHYWNMENELVEWMSSPVAKVWERIKPFVEEEAILRNEPDYYDSARRFGDHCVKWRKQHRPQSKVIDNGT